MFCPQVKEMWSKNAGVYVELGYEVTSVKNGGIKFRYGNHRYRPEIPEPAPVVFRHEAQIWGIQVFPTIKITVIRQVRM